MKRQKILIWFVISLFLTGCSFLQRKAMYGLPDGFYRQIDSQHISRKVYVEAMEDSFSIYPLTTLHPRKVNADAGTRYYLKDNSSSSASIGMLVKTSFDIHLTSVLIKYRFPTPALPNQFSNNFNGALYTGIRKDIIHFRNYNTPLKTKRQHMNHFELDGGAFAGLGTTPINASVTNNNITVEYDGLVLQEGVAAFVGIQNLSIGLGLGWDQLMDKYRRYWIYRGKTWIGLILGLKLSK